MMMGKGGCAATGRDGHVKVGNPLRDNLKGIARFQRPLAFILLSSCLLKVVGD